MTGEANLVFTVLSRSIRGLGRFEQTLGRRLPGLQVLESTVHVRSVKRMGWMLDAAGRCTGEVVVPAVFGP